MPGRWLADARGFTLMEVMIAASVSLIVLFAIYTTIESTSGTYDAGEQRADIQQEGRFAAEMLTRELRLIGYGFVSGGDCNGDTVADNAVLAATPTAITFCADVRNASTTLAGDGTAGDTTLDVDDASGIALSASKGKGANGDELFLMAGGTWEQVWATAVNTGVTPNTVTVNVGIANDFSLGIPVGRPKPITYSWTAGTLSKDDGEGGGLVALAEGIQALQLQYFDGNDVEILPANLAANLANIRRIRSTITLQSGQGSLGAQNFTITSNVRVRNL